MKIIIGLGNPGENYKNTRHNTGFMAIDYLVNQLDLTWEQNKKFNAEVTSPPPSPSKGEGVKVLYVKPQTFMNNSGQAIQAVLSYYKLLPKKLGVIRQKNTNLSDVLTIIHDDLDIELGKYKISIDSRSAGHQGVESIINHLKTKNFKRIRIGIKGIKPAQMPTENYVLQKFSQEELKIINHVIPEIIKLA